MTTDTSPLTYVALATAVLFWGMSFVATKIALESLSPASYMLGRFALAAVPFALLLLRRGGTRLPGWVHLRLAAIALVEPGLYFFFETEGLARTSAPKAAIIIATLPVVVAIASRIVLGERMRPRAMAGAVVSVVGVAVLVLADSNVGASAVTARVGDLLVGGAVISAVIYMLLVRSVAHRVSALQITSYQILYGTLFFAALFAVRPGGGFHNATPEAAGAIVFLAFFATIAAFFAYNYALSQVPAGRASIALNGIPVVTAVTAWLVLGELLSGLQMLGGGLVIVGVTLANYSRGRRKAGIRRSEPEGSPEGTPIPPA